jgi:predicted membrane-bound spermidine synthase
MMIAIFFWWIGLSIVVAVAADTRGRSPIASFIYAIIFSPLLGGLLPLALPNLANSFAAGRMYLEGELEERRRRRAIVARIAAVVVVLMGIVAWMMLA